MIGTFEQAMIFMQRGIDYQSIVVEEVRYEGKTVGYLLTYRYPPYSAKQGRREVNLYEKDGTIYFSVERQLFVY
jgi:hypothetical protein